jgi:hypothetical protein
VVAERDVGMVLEAAQSRRRSCKVMVVCLLKHMRRSPKVEWSGDYEDQYHTLIESFKVFLLKMSDRRVGWFGGVL